MIRKLPHKMYQLYHWIKSKENLSLENELVCAFKNLQNEIMMKTIFKIHPTSVTDKNLFSSSREDSTASRTGY